MNSYQKEPMRRPRLLDLGPRRHFVIFTARDDDGSEPATSYQAMVKSRGEELPIIQAILRSGSEDKP